MTHFGRYVLDRPLGRGGMGEVYLAHVEGPEGISKRVVLKRIRAERAGDEAARARFVEEARVSLALTHPQIVPVFDFGERDGEYFIAMEWVRGANLRAVLLSGALESEAVALVGSQIAEALAYVHARSDRQGQALRHGDLTPSNVLVSRDGYVLLSDFGLAMFSATARAGTPRYMSPEQARGDRTTPASDVYSLGIVLYEALTGARAYADDEKEAIAQAQVGLVPMFSAESEVTAAIARALAPRPENRPTARQLHDAFESALARPGARTRGREVLARKAATFDESADVRASEPSRVTAATRSAAEPAPVAVAARVRGVVWAFGIAAMIALGAFVWWQGRPPIATTPHHAIAKVAPPTTPPVTPLPSPSPRAPEPMEHAALHRARATVGAESPVSSVASARLDLNAKPWAHVRVNGRRIGETPLVGLELAPGEYTVELTNEPLGVTRELKLVLEAGEHLRRIEDLTHE